jgi:hypothetical protein
MSKTHGIVVLALSACATAAFAGPPLGRETAMKLLARPGTWLEADGSLMPDGTLSGKDFEIHAAVDTVGEDRTIYGAIGSINRAQSTMKVLGYVVTWDEKTTIKDENKHQILSSKLQDGIAVKVQGTLLPNGSFKANKFRLTTEKAKGAAVKPKEKVFGPVTVVDAKRGLLRILKTSVSVRDNATFVEWVRSGPPVPTR